MRAEIVPFGEGGDALPVRDQRHAVERNRMPGSAGTVRIVMVTGHGCSDAGARVPRPGLARPRRAAPPCRAPGARDQASVTAAPVSPLASHVLIGRLLWPLWRRGPARAPPSRRRRRPHAGDDQQQRG